MTIKNINTLEQISSVGTGTLVPVWDASALYTKKAKASQFSVGHTHNAVYAPINKGVTGGDSHAHSGGEGGTLSFLTLGDTPSSYNGQGSKVLKVSVSENAVEFGTVTEAGTSPFHVLGDENYTTLASAITTIGSTETTLVIPAESGNITVSSSKVIPSNIHLKVMRGSPFTIASGVTLTINGVLDAGSYKLFAGSGVVRGLKVTDPCWFGAVPDTGTDDAVAINKACTTLASGGTVLFRKPGVYDITGSQRVNINSDTLIDASNGRGSVVIRVYTTTQENLYGWFQNADLNNGNSNITIQNLVFHRQWPGGMVVEYFDHIVYFKVSTDCNIRHCDFLNDLGGDFAPCKQVDYEGCPGGTVEDCTFKQVKNYVGSCLGFHHWPDMTYTGFYIKDCKFGDWDLTPGENAEGLIASVEKVFIHNCDFINTGNNEFGNAGQALAAIDTDMNYDLEITSNRFYSTGIDANMSRVIIHGNSLYNTNIGFGAYDNDSKLAVEHVTVVNNIFYGTSGVGGTGLISGVTPNASNYGSGVLISRNQFIGGATAETASNGIKFYRYANITISENDMLNVDYDAIMTEHCHTVNIVGNTLTNPVLENHSHTGAIYTYGIISLKIASNSVIDRNLSTYLSAVYTAKFCRGIQFTDNKALIYKPGIVFLNTYEANHPVMFSERRGNIYNFMAQEPSMGEPVGKTSSPPSSGTWHKYARVMNSSLSVGATSGWTCTTGGTHDVISIANVSLTSASNMMTFTSMSKNTINEGSYISVSNGFSSTGPYIILDLIIDPSNNNNAKGMYINAKATSTATCHITNYAPSWAKLPNLAAL